MLFVLFGFAVGVYGTMVGAGGGFLIVPALLLGYHASAEQAVGTSITVVFFNALSGTISYARQKRIDYKAGLTFAAATVPGAIAGAFLTSSLAGRTFDVIFAIFLIAISMYLLWRPIAVEHTAESLAAAPTNRWLTQRSVVDAHGDEFHYQYDVRRGIALSLIVGVLSSLLGIGGGIIHVPALIHLLGFPTHLATATSHFILLVTAGIGSATHLSLGHVLPKPALLMSLGVVVGAQLGAKLGKRLRGPLLVRMLTLALLVVAARLLLR